MSKFEKNIDKKRIAIFLFTGIIGFFLISCVIHRLLQKRRNKISNIKLKERKFDIIINLIYFLMRVALEL